MLSEYFQNMKEEGCRAVNSRFRHLHHLFLFLSLLTANRQNATINLNYGTTKTTVHRSRKS